MVSGERRSIATAEVKHDEAGRRGIPTWPLDAVTLALLALAAAVLATGGWHFRLGTARVSIHSGVRLLAWAAVVSIVRHGLVPRPSLAAVMARVFGLAARRATAVAKGVWRSPAWRAALPPLVASRLATYLVGFLAIGALGLGADSARYSFFDNPFLNMLSRWDANWYTGIATEGYNWNGNPRIENSVVFFPAYPMLIRAGIWLTGAHPAFVGFAVSLLAFAWALAYVYRLARDHFRLDAPAAAVSMTAWYPFAVFFGAIYTESLFLLALTGAFYHAGRRERWPTAAWACLAALTKPSGFVIVAPLAVLFGLQWWRDTRDGDSWRDFRAARGAFADMLVLAVPLLAVAGFSLFLWSFTGDPLAWLHGQQAWSRVYRGPVDLVASSYHFVSGRGLARAVLSSPVVTLNTAAVLFALAAVVPVFLRLGAAYAVLVLVLTLPPLLAGGTLSMGRFTSCLFPVFIWLAAAVPARHRGTVYAFFAAGQALVAILFLTWRPLY